MAKTIKNMTGISFDGAAIIDFGGFKKSSTPSARCASASTRRSSRTHMSMVDGKPMWNADAKKTGKPMNAGGATRRAARRWRAGRRWTTPGSATACRNGDYDRQQNQQQLIKAMAKKATESGHADQPGQAQRS